MPRSLQNTTGSQRNYVCPTLKLLNKEHSSIESIVALETPSQYVMTVAESQDQRGPLIALLPVFIMSGRLARRLLSN
jgi:hypothetical protein